jgi:dihydrofolate synthase / folylpolyglutamate synthase
MNYQQTIEYLYSRLPMFSSLGKNAIKPGLTNIIRFCKLLNDPQTKFKSIHVGGTNGKGSTSHMLAAILQTAGYKTGLYTSPHLRDFRERIRINGEMISETEVIRFVEEQKETIEEIEPSFFETTVALAFDHFVKHQVEIAVIEVGLGGRLDSTNIIRPELSVITNIGLDHVNILGDTLEQIAGEKAGIIKPGVPVVIGERQEEIAAVFLKTALEAGSGITFASEKWVVERESKEVSQKSKVKGSELLAVTVFPKSSDNQIFKSSNYLLDLTGSYQLKNLATVLSSVEQLRAQGFLISDDHVRYALQQVSKLTGLMGRWQTLNTSPLVICDTGHNADGIKEVLENIAATPYENLHMVIGMVKDKDISRILRMLPKEARYYFCQPDIPRAKEAEALKAEAEAAGLNGQVYSSIRQALDAAKNAAGINDLIFLGGSTFVVAEVV